MLASEAGPMEDKSWLISSAPESRPMEVSIRNHVLITVHAPFHVNEERGTPISNRGSKGKATALYLTLISGFHDTSWLRMILPHVGI